MSAEKMQDGELTLTWPANRTAQFTMERDADGRVIVRLTVEPEAKADSSAGTANPAAVSPESPVATTPTNEGTQVEQKRLHSISQAGDA